MNVILLIVQVLNILKEGNSNTKLHLLHAIRQISARQWTHSPMSRVLLITESYRNHKNGSVLVSGTHLGTSLQSSRRSKLIQ